jgi:hypothetical protein
MHDDSVKVTCTLVHHPLVKTALAYRFDTAGQPSAVPEEVPPAV